MFQIYKNLAKMILMKFMLFAFVTPALGNCFNGRCKGQSSLDSAEVTEPPNPEFGNQVAPESAFRSTKSPYEMLVS